MKASELRIGNLVYEDGNASFIQSVSNDGMQVIDMQTHMFIDTIIEDLQPIPLTDEWLMRFWFRKTTELTFTKKIYASKSLALVYNKNAKKWTYPYYHGCPTLLSVDYVHQLQNLFFIITGKELKIKNVNNGRK